VSHFQLSWPGSRELARPVVGQMLDCAANGAQYWDAGMLQQLFQGTCTEAGRDPGAVLEEVIGADGDVEDFWAQAGRTCAAGSCGWCSSPM
jgi:hypothetical protein